MLQLLLTKALLDELPAVKLLVRLLIGLVMIAILLVALSKVTLVELVVIVLLFTEAGVALLVALMEATFGTLVELVWMALLGSSQQHDAELSFPIRI